MGRVSNGIEIGRELSEPVHTGVFAMKNGQENVTEEVDEENVVFNQQRNNNFMKRNIKVREWSSAIHGNGHEDTLGV